MRRYTIALMGVIAVLLMPLGAQAAQIYTTALTITAEDLIATDVGRQVKDFNDKMRRVEQAAQSLPKGSHAYNTLVQEFADLKRQRDDVGKNLRGLRGKELVFYGDRANAEAYDFKQRFISLWQQNQDLRQVFSSSMVHVSYDKSGQIRVDRVPPAPENVDSYVADSGSAGTSSTTTVTPEIYIDEGDEPTGVEDPCAYVMGMPNPDPACTGQ